MMKVLPVLVVVAAVVLSATDAMPGMHQHPGYQHPMYLPHGYQQPGYQQHYQDRTIPITMDTAMFSGLQEGHAQSKSNTFSDSRGLTNAELQAGLLDSGRIQGMVSSTSPDGSAGSGAYEGQMHGMGGLWTDTQSLSDLGGSVAQTQMKGVLQSPGSFAGGVGSGASGYW